MGENVFYWRYYKDHSPHFISYSPRFSCAADVLLKFQTLSGIVDLLLCRASRPQVLKGLCATELLMCNPSKSLSKTICYQSICDLR